MQWKLCDDRRYLCDDIDVTPQNIFLSDVKESNNLWRPSWRPYMKLTNDALELLSREQLFYLVNFVECGARVRVTTMIGYSHFTQ